jgi:hypothetical protein
MMENIIIRCFFCNTVLEQKHIDIDPLTGAMTIKVGECEPCMDEAWDNVAGLAYEDDED